MISVTKFRSGTTFEYKNDPWRVLEYKHVHLSRGSGMITIRAKNLSSGSTQIITFRSGDRVPEISIDRNNLTLLYKEEDAIIFMDPVTFEQQRLSGSLVKETMKYLVEGDDYLVFFWKSNPIDIEISPKMKFKVVEASPGVKGDTVSGATKGAVLENGLRLRVPLFIKEGDKIVVDTRTGDYVERVSS